MRIALSQHEQILAKHLGRGRECWCIQRQIEVNHTQCEELTGENIRIKNNPVIRVSLTITGFRPRDETTFPNAVLTQHVDNPVKIDPARGFFHAALFILDLDCFSTEERRQRG